MGSKGATYPYYFLEDGLLLGKAVKEQGGNTGGVSKALLAQSISAEEDTASFSQRLTSAKSFGIISGIKSYSLTQTGMKYFFPEDAAHPREALVEFLKTPAAFKPIIEKFDGNALPTVGILRNVLLGTKLVPVSWANRVAQIFVKSAKMAEVIDASGVLRIRSTLDGLHAKLSEAPPPSPAPKAVGEESAVPVATVELTGVPVTGQDAEVYQFAGIYMRVSHKITPESWDKLNRIVQAIKPM